MDTDKIIQDLNRRFGEPLSEFYKRRIIFWYDEDQEFADRLDEIVLENAKVIQLTGKNTFTVKKLLSNDDLTSNFLVYAPFSLSKPEDNWLLDIELYSDQFHADLISIWMNELGLPFTPSMRDQMKQFQSFFRSKERRLSVFGQSRTASNPAQLKTAVIAAICGLRDPQPYNILRTILRSGLDQTSNSFYQKLITFNAVEAFWEMVSRGCGYQEKTPDLKRLAIHLVLTASAKTLRSENLPGLDLFVSIPHQAYCYDFAAEWLNSVNNDQFYEIAKFVESETRLYDRLKRLSPEDLITTECLPCINEIILEKLMIDISNDIVDVNSLTAIVDKRKTCAWYEPFADFYEGIYQFANMYRFFREHAAGFHTVEPAVIWKEYTSEYYKMDSYYRLFQLAFQKTLENSNIVLDDLFKKVVDKAENLYRYWFLGSLSNNWSNACEQELAVYGKILDVPHQSDFYRYKVKLADNKVFVIISDALRYEVGVSLAEHLRSNFQCKVHLDSMQSIFPSYTKYGMAALLPHDKLTASIQNGVLNVYADGQSTVSTNRDKVLKNKNKASVALQYKDIIGMKRAERSALVKGKDIVYIYHDIIDETGHDAETDVFPACERAISNISNIVRIITNDFGGTNILITADHGFLYTYSPFVESDKVGKLGFRGKEVELSRRYVIMEKGSSPEYLMPVKFLDGTAFDGFTPKENIRIKASGGINYVHGGVSLQELVVPVIEFRHLRNSSAEYQRNKSKYDIKPVSVNLLSVTRKICNMIFALNFYQKEAVGNNRSAATYLVYFTDSYGKQISDVQKIIADKTSETTTDRTFRCSFSLKPLKYSNTESYYLVIANEQDLLMPQREEFKIDIAFADDNFDF